MKRFSMGVQGAEAGGRSAGGRVGVGRHCFPLKAACHGGLKGSVCISARLTKLRRIVSVSHNHRCYTHVYSCCIRALTVLGAGNPEETQAAWCGHTPGTLEALTSLSHISSSQELSVTWASSPSPVTTRLEPQSRQVFTPGEVVCEASVPAT